MSRIIEIPFTLEFQLAPNYERALNVRNKISFKGPSSVVEPFMESLLSELKLS